MTDRFDDAKRALEGVPANDVWAEAERRAGTGTGTVVPLSAAAGGGRRHPGRWLAGVAAVAALAVGTVAVLASDDDAPVDAGLTTPDNPGGEPLTVYGDELIPGCVFGIRGEPVLEPHTLGGVESPTGDREVRGTLAEGALNGQQSYSIQSPGQMVIDLVGERVEDVDLQRGTAQLWFQPDAVQVRSFTGGQDACESFTVTVSGGTEDGNRHAAVDLAERVVLESELPDDDPVDPTPGSNPLAGTEWQLERVEVGGETTDGDGSTFTFTDTDVEWTDGCNGKFASYVYGPPWDLLLDSIGTTDVFCEPNPTSDVINAVMVEGGIEVIFEGDLLTLRTLDGELTLRPLVRGPGPVGSGDAAPDDDKATARDDPSAGPTFPNMAGRR